MKRTLRRTGLGLTVACALGCDGGVISDPLVEATSAADSCDDGATVLSDPAPLRRLSQAELGNTLTELGRQLGVAVDAGQSPFPDPTVGDYFSNNNRQNSMSLFTTNQLMETAERISDQLTEDVNALLGCEPGEPGCVTRFIERFGRIAFRRPLAELEVTAFTTAYDEVADDDGTRSAVRAIIELAVQSPDFVYITADAVADEDGRLRFDGHSVARRLSYFIWGSMPDAELFAAAAADALQTGDQLRTQVERMLEDPRARESLRRFHREWLAIKEPSALEKSVEIFPDFSVELATDLGQELDAFVEQVVWEDRGGIAQLLRDRSARLNTRVADFYGVQSSSTGNDDWRPATLGDDRRGIVTRAAYLASTASPTGTSPVRRGVAILAKLMCIQLTAPDDVDTTLAEPEPGAAPQTRKEIYAAHTANESCAVCHKQIDPLGFAFEMYDATGAVATTYSNGDPIDSSGVLIDGRSFENAPELIDQLADDPDVAACYARRWLEWSVGRSATAAERCEIAELSATATTSIREAIIELATSDLMLYATDR